ncbi:hypothetical protein PQR02_11600 [Paraburkholderia sediminicola]|uniref:Uncharacterized protein n=1 Tax=Paraburkholderia rhynchosiae TaxID=487049 RepID=A0ACC7NN46_9BURK
MELNDVLTQAEAKDAELSKRIRQEGDFVVVRVAETAVAKNIPVSELQTAEGLLRWTYELTEKTWMDVAQLRKFMEVAGAAAGIPLYGNL